MYALEITIDRSKALLILVDAAIPGIWNLYARWKGEPGRPGSRLIGLLLFPALVKVRRVYRSDSSSRICLLSKLEILDSLLFKFFLLRTLFCLTLPTHTMTYSNGASNGASNGVSNGVSKKTNGAVKSAAPANGADVFLDESITVLPNAPQLVPGLLQEVLSEGIAFSGNHDANARVKLLDAARSLATALETPKEAMLRYCWSQSTIYAAIETSVDLGLFAALSHDDSPKSASVLAEATGADPNLLGVYTLFVLIFLRHKM